jgi:hypothetical protein
MIEATGHWANCDVWLQAPASWQDVELVLVGYSGNVEAILDHRSVRDMQSPFTPANGIILSARGRRCDRFAVYAYNTTIDHDLATFHMELWGQDGSGFGDRATRAIVDPYARPNQINRYASPNPFPVGVLTPVAAANPSGQRIGLLGIEWTNDQSVGVPWPLLTLTDTAINVLGRWSMTGAGVVSVSFAPPIYTAPGVGLQLQITGGPGGVNFINATYLYE